MAAAGEEGVSEIQRYMGLATACEYLGMTERSMRWLVETSQIPYSKRSRRLIFDREKLDKWVADDERALHDRFAHLRQHGEWFTDCDEIRSYISEHASLPSEGKEAA